MPSEKTALRKRITPSAPVTIKVENSDGSSFELSWRLTFDFNTMALVEEHTGLSMLTGEVFSNPDARRVSVLLWAAALEHQPEYEGMEGLEAIRSYLTIANTADVLHALDNAFMASLPKEKADELRAAAEAKKNKEAGQAAPPADPTPAPSA